MAKTYKKIAGVWTPIKKVYRNIASVWTEAKKVYRKIAGTWTIVHSGAILVDNNVDAYAVSAAGDIVEYADKGELFVNGAGVLQAADGSRLGKLMDVWFTTDAYAINAAQYINQCYAYANGNRVADNKDWLLYRYSTCALCASCSGCPCSYSFPACKRDIYYNRYEWR